MMIFAVGFSAAQLVGICVACLSAVELNDSAYASLVSCNTFVRRKL